MPGNFTAKSDGAVQAGGLRRRLTIQQPTLTADGNAGATVGYTNVLNPVYGALTSWKPTIQMVGDRMVTVVWARFLIRYQPTPVITSGMRLIDNDPDGSAGSTYTIIGALDPDGTKRQLHILAQQIIQGT